MELEIKHIFERSFYMYSVNRGVIWSYAILLLITIVFTFIELNQPYETPEDAQSRFELHFQPIFTFLMISASILAFKLHKRLQVFAGPIFILLGSFWYLWVFMSFTIGWVRMQGFLGLGFGLIICFILTIYHLYTNLKNRNKPSM
jgi:hypothetical protein